MPERVKRQRRFHISLPLWVRIQKQFRGKKPKTQAIVEEETITENISSTGCYFLVSEKPPVGSIAEMQITVPHQYRGSGKGTLHCRGKVVRVEERTETGKVGVACTIDSYTFYV